MKLLLSLVGGTLSVIAAAAVHPASPSHINPALIYNRAFLVAPDLDRADSDYLQTNRWDGRQLTERFEKLVAQYDEQFELVLAAAKSDAPCDWGIDFSRGPATWLPHLARAKSIALTTRLRVLWHLQHGRQSEAVDEWLAALALARNVAADGTLISALVQIAIESIETSTLATHFGRFTPESLQRLARGMDQAPARRSVVDCAPVEKAYFLDWTLNRVRDLRRQFPQDDARVLEGIRPLLSLDEPEAEEPSIWSRILKAGGGTSDGVIKLLDEFSGVFARISGILALPYTEYLVQAPPLVREMEASANPLIGGHVPGIVRAREKEFRVLAYLAAVRAAIAHRLEGEAAFRSVPDPCGNGPFALKRFLFQGVDRGFEVRSAFHLGQNLAVLIFVEKEGPPFQVSGNYPGQAVAQP